MYPPARPRSAAVGEPISCSAAPSSIFASFWMGGFEGADHTNSHGVPLHINESNGHAHWMDQDYAALAQLGLRTVRETIGWRAGTGDDGGLDVARLQRRAESAARHGLQVIWTLHHYGLPAGADFFADDFAARFAGFCDAVARALRGQTDSPTLFQPVNEISFLSWAAGSTNLIHPYLGESSGRAYELKCRLVMAALQGCDALWATQPLARMVHTDPLIHVAPDADAEDADQQRAWSDCARAHTRAQFEAWDMLCGRLEPGLGGAPRYLDVVGVNYYHDNQWLYPSGKRLHWHLDDPRRCSLHQLLGEVWQRYERPLFIAETGHVGAGRARWLDTVAREVQTAIAVGTPVLGICLYPVLDRPDWEAPALWHRSGIWEVRGHACPPQPAADGLQLIGEPSEGALNVAHLPSAAAPAAPSVPPPALARWLHAPLAHQIQRWQRVLPHVGAARAWQPSRAPPGVPCPSSDSPPFHSQDDSMYLPETLRQPNAFRDATHAARPTTTIIVFSHLRWDFVYQRPQQLLSRLASHFQIVFVEEPVPGATFPTLEVMDPEPGVRVLRAHVASDGAGFHDAHMPQTQALLAGYLEAHAIDAYWLWFYTPMALPLASGLTPQGIVYDCMDELSAFKFAPAELLQREEVLFSQADLVFTGGHSLYEAKRSRHPSVHCFPSSVDAAHFARAQQPGHMDHVAQAQLPRPRLGYFGVIDERIDLQLVADIADARADWQVIMVGPVVKIDPALLPQRSNLHWLGQRDYAELPEFVGGWDVCLMPFALNESTRFISPTKTLEYLAAGRPVVSTPIRDVVTPYAGIVAIAGTSAAFVAACEAALVRSPEAKTAQTSTVHALLARTSWDGTASAMAALLQARQMALLEGSLLPNDGIAAAMSSPAGSLSVSPAAL